MNHDQFHYPADGRKIIRRIVSRNTAFLWVAVCTLLLAGCSTSKQTQLEHAAKDWCMTIRACQVLPVYPLTEDLQPGDIFLVQVPIDRQQQVYRDRGFLPLDNHLDRLNPDGYTNFYAHSFFGRGAAMLPGDWIRPAATNTHPWEAAPHAAFPTYSFSIRHGGGVNLAVPIQGVPVGLSLLGADAAYGSVTIRNASTLGVDMLSLHRQVVNWARANAGFLTPFEPTANETNYLRVVTRVYATGAMDVELRDATSRSAGADVGVAKPVDLLFPQLAKGTTNVAETVAQNYTNGWNVLADLLQKAASAAGKMAPGGSLRLMAASGRNVALQETFDPPLLLGYLGFDCAILDRGELGPPVPTHAQLDPKSHLHHAKVQAYNSQLKAQISAYDAITARYASAPPAAQWKIQALARKVKLSAAGDGDAWIQNLGVIVDGNDPAKTEHFDKLKQLVNELK
jgi:hypothetical protein